MSYRENFWYWLYCHRDILILPDFFCSIVWYLLLIMLCTCWTVGRPCLKPNWCIRIQFSVGKSVLFLYTSNRSRSLENIVDWLVDNMIFVWVFPGLAIKIISAVSICLGQWLSRSIALNKFSRKIISFLGSALIIFGATLSKHWTFFIFIWSTCY